MNDLPINWTCARLGEVIFDFQAGFACGKKDVKDGLVHLRMNNIDVNGNINTELIRRVPIHLAKDHHYLQKGDILFCSTNSSKLVGKCTVFELNEKAAFSNHLTRLRVNPEIINNKLLQLYLWNFWKKGGFESRCKHWVNQSTLPKAELLINEILLPPISEQRRIVAKLEKLLQKVDACKERLDKIPTILKRFRQSILAAACSGRLTADWREEGQNVLPAKDISERIQKKRLDSANTPAQKKKIKEIYSYQEKEDSDSLSENWRYIALDKLCESFQYGTSKKSMKAGKIPVLRMGNLQNGEIDWSDLAYTSDDNEIEKYKLNLGDVLFNRTNSPELVGKTSIYRGNHPAIFAGYLIKINNFEELDSEYLNYCLNSAYAKAFCLRVKTDGVSQSNVNAKKLGKFEVPFCSSEEQKEIVCRVEALFKFADKIEERYKKARTYVDKLTQSILAKAFRGELVAQDPNDEPASELLKRIKEKRSKNESNGYTGRIKRKRKQ